MGKPLIPIVLLFLLFSNAAFAENDESIQQAMLALDGFMLAFNARDPEAWAETLNYPHVRFASEGVTVWDSAESFAENARNRSFVALPQAGWDHSHWLSREIILASENKVHVSTTFQRYNSANEIIGTYESLYIVTRINGHWGTQARSSLAP